MVLTITTAWLVTVLAIDMLAGFGLGFMTAHLRWRIVAPPREEHRTAAKAPPRADDPQPLMEDIRGALASHARTLAEFEQWLTPDAVATAGRSTQTAAVVKIAEVRQANRTLEDQLDERFDQLLQVVQTYRHLLRDQLDQLGDYRRRTQELDQVLAEFRTAKATDQLAEMVFKTVHDLRHSNRHLTAELEDCQRQLAEQTARAGAAENDARVDVLTQLPNRRAFEEKLTEQQSLNQRRGQPFVLVLFDVDRFKRINDTYGHTTGDAVLAMLGRVFRNCRRATDHVSRFGGEEFALLVPLCTNEGGEAVAERYRQRIEAASLQYNGQRLQVTISAGVAAVQVDDTKEQLLERADRALYTAKKAGGNRTHVDNGQTAGNNVAPIQCATGTDVESNLPTAADRS